MQGTKRAGSAEGCLSLFVPSWDQVHKQNLFNVDDEQLGQQNSKPGCIGSPYHCLPQLAQLLLSTVGMLFVIAGRQTKGASINLQGEPLTSKGTKAGQMQIA